MVKNVKNAGKSFSSDILFGALKAPPGSLTREDVNKISIDASGAASKIEIQSASFLVDLTIPGICLFGVDIIIGVRGARVKLPHSTSNPHTAVGFTAKNNAAGAEVSVYDPGGILVLPAAPYSDEAGSGTARVYGVLETEGEAEISFADGLTFKITSVTGDGPQCSFYTVTVS